MNEQNEFEPAGAHEAEELSDGVVRLRKFTLADVDEHVAGDDEEQARWLSGGHRSTPESVTAWIERNEQYWRAGGPVYNFAVVDEEDKLVGMVEANTGELEGLASGDANISYAIYPAYRGHGYVTRAVSVLEDFLRAKKIRRAVIRVDAKNKASLSVPLRLNYSPGGEVTTSSGDQLQVFTKRLADTS